MPTSIKCSLSPPTAIDVVADLICAMNGQKAERRMFSRRAGLIEDDFYNKYKYKYVLHETMPMCVGIEYKGADDIDRHILFHFEYGDDGSRGFGPISTMHNATIAKKLVTLLGGKLTYSDMDTTIDYEVKLEDSVFYKEGMFGTSDEPYLKRQAFIRNMPVLDIAEFQEGYDNCVYKDEEDLLEVSKFYSNVEKNVLTESLCKVIKRKSPKRKV